ncbi:MAG: hypothetical protein O3A25_19205 [Acidobacteria bacterium]|nr:hypothetical protein [Acidobacteriota bacterium]
MAIITTGRYLKREDVTEAGSIHRIVSVVQEALRTGTEGETELKWLLTVDDLKPLILNATNIRRLVAAFESQDTDDWIGQRIVLYDDPTIEFGGKQVGGVRVRAVPRATPKKKPASTNLTIEDIPF